jgi:hypothetical protein
MVDPEEFERVRTLVAEALDEAFAGRAMQPWERTPGHWYFWPARYSDLRIEPIGIWHYGKRIGDVDRLQAVIRYHYSQSERIRQKSSEGTFGKKEAAKAAKLAKEIADRMSARHGLDDPGIQEAYKLGYLLVETAPEADKERLWGERENTYRDPRANWDRMWAVVGQLLKIRDLHKGSFDWSPSETEDLDHWKPLEDMAGEERVRRMAHHGGLHALDDWAFERGLLVEEPEEGNLVLAR